MSRRVMIVAMAVEAGLVIVATVEMLVVPYC